MATYQQLIDDTQAWLNRRDILPLIPGWVLMVETEIAQTLRARCMVTSGIQPIDAAYISLPADFATMESIRDATSGEKLKLEDQWTGSWGPAQVCTAYRLTHDCIEFLPHPFIPDPPDPNWLPQQVLMGWYAKPRPLLLPTDTNAVLEQLYGVYLWGVCKYGALFELDDDRAQQCDAQFQQAVTRADLHKQMSDYSGAPFRAELVEF